MLIGQDFSEALIPLDVRKGGFSDPFAVRTMFGWSLNGPLKSVGNASPGAASHFANISVVQKVNHLKSSENECFVDEIAWSENDDVINLSDNSVCKIDAPYQLQSTWKFSKQGVFCLFCVLILLTSYNLIQLDPMLDANGMLRVRDCTKVAHASESCKQPCLNALQTLMCEVETIVHVRPIIKSREKVNDLTHYYLLLLREQQNVSPGQIASVALYKYRWCYAQHMEQELWRVWLLDLQRRQKWRSKVKNVVVAYLVLIKDGKTPRDVRPMGLVKEIKCSSDGLLRIVTVKTISPHLVRPVIKITLFEVVNCVNKCYISTF